MIYDARIPEYLTGIRYDTYPICWYLYFENNM